MRMNGIDYSTKTDSSKCPICDDTGFERYINDAGYEVFRDCPCGLRMRQIASKRLSFANLPSSFKDYKVCNFPTNSYKKLESRNEIMNALKKIAYWIKHLDEMENKGMGLYLWSETKGSGKTRMVGGIANDLLGEEYKKQVKFATSMQIINEIKNTWNNNVDMSESTLLNDLARTQYLIIDDFGTEQAKDWISERFYSIINQRYIDKKVTLFTSNMPIDSLNYDDRITNRIKEMCYEIHFPEESIREQIQEEHEKELLGYITIKK